MADRAHWEASYRVKAAELVSWFKPSADPCLALIEATGFDHEAPLIDVGGDASRPLGRLPAAGYAEVTVRDISSAATAQQCQPRLGANTRRVQWLRANITRADLRRRYRPWHERAVFQLLVDAHDRAAYPQRLKAHLEAGGQAIIATFDPDGPPCCSGLAVQRYDVGELAQTLGSKCRLVNSQRMRYTTADAARQAFVYCRFEHANQSNG